METALLSQEATPTIDQALDAAYEAMPAQDRSRYRVNRSVYREFLVSLVGMIGPLKGRRILDVGAGRGILALAISNLGADVLALEKYVFDHSVSEMFHEGNEEEILRVWRNHRVEPLLHDLNELTTVVPANSCDAVVSMEVIEHLKEPKRLIEGMVQVVKPGGLILVATPNYGRMHARLRLLFGKNPKMDLETFYRLGTDGFIGHWREYLPDELGSMLKWGGLTDVRVKTICDPWYALSKGFSFYAIQQTAIHLLSLIVPNSRIELFASARKPTS